MRARADPMRFLAPSVLLGLVAAVLPALLHRIGRRRANPLRFAAMELLVRAERQVAARRRARDVMLLVIRTAAAAALPLLFARPFVDVRSDLPSATGRPQSAVIVLDDSASLQRRAGGIGSGALFEVARSRVRALLENMSPASDVALVLGSEGSLAPIAEPSSDRPRVLTVLDGISCSARRGDLGAAIARAAQIVQTGGHAERHIYLVTDLQASGFPSEVTPVPAGTAVTVLAVGADEAWDNRAVTDLRAEPASEAGAQGVAIMATIVNYGSRPATHLGVTLRLDGAEVARGFVDVEAGGRAQKRFLHALAGTDATHEAEVEIDPDRFPLDDRRLARIEVSRGLRVLVVDGDPRTVRNEDEVFFLEAALRAGSGRFQVQVVMPDDITPRLLDGAAAIFMANVARPRVDVAAALVRWVEAGGGLFISVGDRVDVDAWNQRLRAILPQPLGLRRTAAARPGTLEGETVDTRPAERLAPIDRRHPLLAGFSADGEGLTSARFFEYMLLDPTSADTSARSVVLRYETGAPALIESQVGRGRVLLLTTTVDREWTDLPIRPGFLPLIEEAARRLAGAPSGDSISAILVGAPREIGAAPDDRRIEITKPDGEARALAPEPRAGSDESPERAGRSVIFEDTDRIGAYHVRAFRNNGAWVERPDDAFVVNLDVRESDPAVLPPDRRPDRVPRANGPADQALTRPLELWHALGAALIAFLLLESILTFRWRGSRASLRRPADSPGAELARG